MSTPATPSRPLSSLCVFCGSAPGSDPDFVAHAHALGALLAQRGIRLVYGGGGTGMMGAVADGALAHGGAITGIITRQLVDKELAHPKVADMRVVESMHDRKAAMSALADGFVALPGGYGTLDEFFEIMAWAQLGIHAKPVGMLNTNGFYTPLWEFLDHADARAFLRVRHHSAIAFESDPTTLLDRLCSRASSSVRPQGINPQGS